MRQTINATIRFFLVMCITGFFTNADAGNNVSRTEVISAVIDTLNGILGPPFGPNTCIPGDVHVLANNLNDRLPCQEITPQEIADIDRNHSSRCATVSDLVKFLVHKCKS